MFSFLTSLSSSIYLYVIAALLSMSVLFGGLLYGEIGKTAEAESALVSAIDANTNLQNSLNQKGLSCKLDDKAVVELHAVNDTAQEVVDDVSTQLQSHASVKKSPIVNAVQPSPVQLPSKEKSNNEITYLPDDGLLSPTITGLLHKSFCNAEPTDTTCVSTGQPSH